MKCNYCGKVLKEEGASIYAQGELIAVWCNSICMGKAFKRMKRLVKKMSPEQLIKLAETKKKETK